MVTSSEKPAEHRNKTCLKQNHVECHQAKSTGKADNEENKMAAIRGNTPKRRSKQSMAEELMSLVSEEEYVELVQ